MNLKLTKHHGLGNDFLVTIDPDVDDLPALARRLCDRRTGVGADGLLVANVKEDHATRMTIYNADGSRAEMSGNGIRCFAQAMAAHHDDLEPQLIATDAGERLVSVDVTDDPSVIVASVDMGPIDELDEPDGWSVLGVHPDRPVAHLGLGNPHAVVAVDEVGAVDLESLGAKVPDVNLEIVEGGPEPEAVRMRVHERGAGITAACGTGAVAAAAAARRWGLVSRDATVVTVHMDGGDATVVLDEPSQGRATLRGPSIFVGTVEVPLS